MPEHVRGRPVVAGAPLVASLVASLIALLLGGCGGPANTSAPVAADQPLVYTYDGAQDAGIIAISERDGATLWRAPFGFRSGTAITAGDVVYACMYPATGGLGEDVLALRLRDGKQLWRDSLVPPSQEAGACAFATDGTTLALVGGQRAPSPGDGSTLYALDAADGAIRWRQTMNAMGRVFLQHGALYTLVDTNPMLSDSLAVAAFSASDGKPLWSVPFAGLSTGRGFVGDDRALYTDEHGQAISALALGDGRRLWDHAFAQGAGLGLVVAVTDQSLVIGSPTQSGGTQLSALAITDGRQLWRSPTDVPFSLSGANLAITQSDLYTIGDRDVVAIRLSDGAQVWRTDLAQEKLSVVDQVVALSGVVFVLLEPAPCYSICPGRAPRVVALDGATGAVYWRQDAPGAETWAASASP